MSSVEAKLVYQKYDEMMELLRSYRERIYQQWVAGVDKDCHFNLGQPLIQRDPVTNLRQTLSQALVTPWFGHMDWSPESSWQQSRRKQSRGPGMQGQAVRMAHAGIQPLSQILDSLRQHCGLDCPHLPTQGCWHPK